MENLFPGLKKIEACPIEAIEVSPIAHYKVGDQVHVSGTFTDCNIVGLAKLETDAKPENNTELHTVTLTYFTQCPPLDHTPFCYRITDIHGNQYLLGTPEKPYPIQSYKHSIPNQSTQRRGFDVTVSYKNTHSLLEIK